MALILSGCIEPEQFGPVTADPARPNLNHPGIWLVNEGGFTLGQGSLSYFDLLEDSVYNDVFRAINGRPLGDVLQHLSFHRGHAYLVVNNSRKVEVVDSATFESLYTLDGLASPRRVYGYEDRLVMTDLFSNTIRIYDANTYELIREVESGGWTEAALIHEGQLFVTVQQTFEANSPGSRKGLLIYSWPEMTLERYLPLAQGANSLHLDEDGAIWVLCDGGLEEETGGLFRLNEDYTAVDRSLLLPDARYSATQLTGQGESLYFLRSDPEGGTNAFDLIKMDRSDTILPEDVLLAGEGRYLYGYHLNPERNMLLVTDAVGLLQEGFLFRYDLSTLELQKRYLTGIFPSQLVSGQ